MPADLPAIADPGLHKQSTLITSVFCDDERGAPLKRFIITMTPLKTSLFQPHDSLLANLLSQTHTCSHVQRGEK